MYVPKLPQGPIIPNPHFLSDVEKLIKEVEEKKQRDFAIRLEIFSCICGGIMGLITSLLFWLITK